ncbi:MAG TPA: flagellar hook-length control protein FliK [Planctomycetes bacterium]|nr:flagellar hook-length control protein FliK [Planctomycetota bacterium]
MQLTPFGRLEIKLDDLPTITDDPRDSKVDFDKIITKEKERESVQKPEPKVQDPAPDPSANHLAPALAPSPKPKAETPDHSPEPKPDTPTHPSDSPGEEAMGDTLSLSREGAESRPKAAPQNLVPTRPRLILRKAPSPEGPFPVAPISGRGAPGASSAAAGNQGVASLEKSGASTLGKSAGNKASEAKDSPKPQKARPSYRSADPKRAELAKAHQDSIFRQVTMALTQEGGSMFLAIDPPSLGHIALELRLDGDKLRLKIRAEHLEVADSLRQGMGQLKSLLLDQGMNVEEFDVRTGTQQEQAQEGRDFAKSFGNSGGEREDGMSPASSKESSLISPLGIRQGNGIDFIA